MIVLLATYAFWLYPAIAAERDAAPGDERSSRFQRLHQWSTRLVGANLLVGLALLAWTAASRRP
jgi:hypothetical protein